jgi:hypothetical protein
MAELPSPINPDQKIVIIKNINFRESYIGLSGGHYMDHSLIYFWPTGFDFCYPYGERHQFEWSNDAIRPKRNETGDVYGCGLLLNSRNELAIFFTFNGVLMGQCPWRQIIVLFPI